MEEKETSIIQEPEKTVQTVPLAYHECCMERNRKTVLSLIIAWALTTLLVVGGFIWMWFQYDYVSTTEYSGVYNLTDSEGNVITSDLSPEDLIKIMEVLENSKSADNTVSGTK